MEEVIMAHHEKYLTAHKKKMACSTGDTQQFFFSQVIIRVLSGISLQTFKRKQSSQEIEKYVPK